MWAVVDVETTGLYWKSVDRVIEIAIVRMDESGAVVDEWETLLNPDRDLGLTSLHGITGRDVMEAPTFADVADEILWRLSGRVPVAHNLRFDLAFLTNEFGRLGFDFSQVQGVCTMEYAGRLGAGRSLTDCCASFGVPLHDHHTALADAEAASGIFARMLADRHSWQYPPPLPAWPPPVKRAMARTRRDPPPSRTPCGLVSLARYVQVPEGSRIDPSVAVSYLDLLDRALEDRHLTDDEVTAMAEFAAAWGIGPSDADLLHRAYVAETWKLAEADGVVSRAEMRDIEILADLLGVPTSPDPAATGLTRDHRSVLHDWAGKSVCFTGTTQCVVGGQRLERADLKEYAEGVGMEIKDNVSGKLDLLVVADPDTPSGKAKRADQLGIPRMYDVAFLRAIGVDCQAGGADDA